MDSLKVKIEGAKELDKALSELEKKVARKLTRQSLRAGAKPIHKEAQSLAPARSGKMRKAIKIKAGRSRRGTMSVLVQIGAKNFTGKEFYGAFQNFGWRQGSRRLGNKRKQIPGKHFMELGFDAKKHEALSTITSTLKTGIESVKSSVNKPTA